MMSKMDCSCGSELRTGSSTPDAEARMRKPAALKIRARPSLSSALGPTRTVPIGPRFIVALADLGRPDGRPVWLSCPAPFISISETPPRAPISCVFRIFAQRWSPSRTRRPHHAPATKLNESPLQSNDQSDYPFRYTAIRERTLVFCAWRAAGVPPLGEEQIAALLQESPLGGAPERGDRDQRSRAGRGGHHRAGESGRTITRPTPGSPTARSRSWAICQTRGCRIAPELSAGGQARRHHDRALYACASVQARQATTEVPAHAARPRHPRPSSQDQGQHSARRPLRPATRSRVACAPSRAASARAEDLIVARPEVECIGRGNARAPCEFGCKVSIVTPVTAPKRAVRAACQGIARQSL